MYEAARKRYMKRASRVRRRLVFLSSESSPNTSTDTSTNTTGSSNDSSTHVGERGDFLEEVFDSVNLGDLNMTPTDQPSAVKEPPAKRPCLLKPPTEWNTREGKLLSKLLPGRDQTIVKRLDQLKYVLKTSRDARLCERASLVYEKIKLAMAQKLVALQNFIEREIQNLDRTMTPESLLLAMRKKDAITAILSVWGLDHLTQPATPSHTDTLHTPPGQVTPPPDLMSYKARGQTPGRARNKMPLQEITVLPDGSLYRPHDLTSTPKHEDRQQDSGYHDNSDEMRSSQHVMSQNTIKTCGPHCCCQQGPITKAPMLINTSPVQPASLQPILSNMMTSYNAREGPSTMRTNHNDVMTRPGPSGILDVTIRGEIHHNNAATKEELSDSDSYCDCNFCRQNSDVRRPANYTPTQEFSSRVSDVSSRDDDVRSRENSCPELPQKSTIYSFREKNTSDITSDDSSVISFNNQDDMMTSSPMMEVSGEGPALDVGNLLILSTKTPCPLGDQADRGLSDSLLIMGSNSHVRLSRLSESEDED